MRQRYVPSAKAWPREKIIRQWERVLHDPQNARYPMVREIATQALANLRAEVREPGADDEQF